MTVQHSSEKRVAAQTLKRQDHTNSRSYKCSECDLTFKSSHQFRYHKQTHTGEMLIACPICGKGIRANNLFKKHLFMHYRDEPKNDMENVENVYQSTSNSHLKGRRRFDDIDPNMVLTARTLDFDDLADEESDNNSTNSNSDYGSGRNSRTQRSEDEERGN